MRLLRAVALVLLAASALTACGATPDTQQDRPWPPPRQFP